MINIDFKNIEIIPLGVNTSGDSGGSGNADLSNYYTKSEVNTKLNGYSKSEHTHETLENFYTKSEVNNLIDDISLSGDSNIDLSEYYTKTEINTIMLDNHISDVFEFNGKLIGANISGNWRNEVSFKTINGQQIIGEEGDIVISGSSYDDTELSNRISAIETELNGVSEQITELNNMVV